MIDSKPTYTHKPLLVRVFIDDWHNNPIKEYVINWNDHSQQCVFAEQANNAIRAHQCVTTMLDD